MFKKLIGLSACVALAFAACKKETATSFDCTGSTPTYTNDVKSIINSNCATSGCHAANNPAEGIDLSTYAKVKAESAKDRFLGSIEHLSGYEAMPDGAAKLSETQIKTISCWIDNGTPE